MKVKFEKDFARKAFEITDEHPSSSYGVPVVVVDGVAYGREHNSYPLHINPTPFPGETDDLPEFFVDGVSKMKLAVMQIVCYSRHLSAEESKFCKKFWL